MNADQVRAKLSGHVRRVGSQRKLADKIGCSVQFLSAILTGKKAPSGKPVAFLGLERVVLYRKPSVPVPCTCRHQIDRDLCRRKNECVKVEAFIAATT